MKRETKVEVIDEFIGVLQPYGDTNYDREVEENIDLAREVLDIILGKLIENTYYDGYEGSCLDVKEKSIKLLKDCNNQINDVLYNVEQEDEE